jgi:hypothetical protein
MRSGKLSIIMIAGLVVGACATAPKDEMAATPGATVCVDPRPQICTMDYRPVCGTLKNGTVKTYSNGCSACADAGVISWVDGACAE